ncbi:MAG: hypothetical protein JXL84_23250 [Deltaproteobacteria bacterium]|nr:hypothetical protein [Deltaproteobacteria bacterium]
MTKRSIVLAFLLVLSLSACQNRPSVATLDDLRGVWETDEPRYERCTFQITAKKIIFENGLAFTDIYYIREIDRAQDGGNILYTIHYENREGLRYRLSLFYSKTEQGPVICFKNQKYIVWTKRPTS